MNELEKRRALTELGQRAVDYYLDTGLCVFCDADDVMGDPHEEHCNVGVLSGITEVTPERRKLKEKQRRNFHALVSGHPEDMEDEDDGGG